MTSIKKKITAILENIQYPKIISRDDLKRLVFKLHYEDSYNDPGEEGNLMNRLDKFFRYHLTSMPIHKTGHHYFQTNPSAIEDYADRGAETMPPIVYDGVEELIIDGCHRCSALQTLGKETVLAYVGMPQDMDPDWEEDHS